MDVTRVRERKAKAEGVSLSNDGRPLVSRRATDVHSRRVRPPTAITMPIAPDSSRRSRARYYRVLIMKRLSESCDTCPNLILIVIIWFDYKVTNVRDSVGHATPAEVGAVAQPDINRPVSEPRCTVSAATSGPPREHRPVTSRGAEAGRALGAGSPKAVTSIIDYVKATGHCAGDYAVDAMTALARGRVATAANPTPGSRDLEGAIS
ncbi:hypothetical protein EVAR_88263_1 [Eumeta japonica]|uniref:Uncharacterized protein n=1 Tax=Eumeta variegata TaxID=151549 RepID=A0A4C1XKJ7_EUMVA|nr:hypothetical protein EVAR_88263_1 [Eumeta japonica]